MNYHEAKGEFEDTEGGLLKLESEQIPDVAIVEKVQANGYINEDDAKSLRNTASLHRKLEQRIEQAKRKQGSNSATKLIVYPVDQQPKRNNIMPISRLPVPRKNSLSGQNVSSGSSIMNSSTQNDDIGDEATQPLVSWIDNSSEDEFEFDHTWSSTSVNKSGNGSLRRSDYNTDEDLDLIPPRPASGQRCSCCMQLPIANPCNIQ